MTAKRNDIGRPIDFPGKAGFDYRLASLESDFSEEIDHRPACLGDGMAA